jgi:hypothetical protein
MNPLTNPDDVHPGAILTRKEFEESAIDAKMVEDLLDEEDLSQIDFMHEVIQRANARRTAQNLHLWVATENYETIVLVQAPYAYLANQVRASLRLHEKQGAILRRTMEAIINAGSKP